MISKYEKQLEQALEQALLRCTTLETELYNLRSEMDTMEEEIRVCDKNLQDLKNEMNYYIRDNRNQ